VATEGQFLLLFSGWCVHADRDMLAGRINGCLDSTKAKGSKSENTIREVVPSHANSGQSEDCARATTINPVSTPLISFITEPGSDLLYGYNGKSVGKFQISIYLAARESGFLKPQNFPKPRLPTRIPSFVRHGAKLSDHEAVCSSIDRTKNKETGISDPLP